MANLAIQKLAERWPSSVVARTEIEKFSGGLMKERYLANLDSKGLGPENRFRCGRKIAYPVNSVIAFLEKRIEPVRSKEV